MLGVSARAGATVCSEMDSMSQGDGSLGRKGAQVARWGGQKASERGIRAMLEAGYSKCPSHPWVMVSGEQLRGQCEQSTVTDKGTVTDVGRQDADLSVGASLWALISFMFSSGRDANRGWLGSNWNFLTPERSPVRHHAHSPFWWWTHGETC